MATSCGKQVLARPENWKRFLWGDLSFFIFEEAICFLIETSIPNEEHEQENYEDLQLDFSHVLVSSLERYLPNQPLSFSRIDKARFMKDILLRYYLVTDGIQVLQDPKAKREDKEQ